MEIQTLIEVLRERDTARLEMLVDDGTIAGAVDENGVSAVMLVAYHGFPEQAKRLLAQRADQADVFEAAVLGDHRRLQELVDQRPALAEALSGDGFSVLGLACFFGHPDCAQVLLDAGADPDAGSQDPSQVKPLNSAAACRDDDAALKLCTLLLGAGADPSPRQQGGWTPLHQAAAHGRMKLVELLLDYDAEVDATSDDGRTPQDMALAADHTDIVERLIFAG